VVCILKLAIVGSSKMKYQQCVGELQKIINEEKPDTIVSGGAEGVDSHAVLVAVLNEVKTKVFKPETNDWEGYKYRNLQIVKECDKLYNLVLRTENEFCYHHNTKQHERSGGCWTEIKAREQGKIVKTIEVVA